MKEQRDPVVGWRLWRVRGAQLESWAASCGWEPGTNDARCLAPIRRCQHPPGRGCRCGFWALFSPLRCFERARAERAERSSVLGLVRGWGEVALHGEEGFRAERAAVICLFTDWAWDAPVMPQPDGGPARLWWGLMAALRYVPRPVAADPWRKHALEDAAAHYGVPLVSLKDALQIGLLDELGVDAAMRREVEAWVDQVGHGRMWGSD